MLTARHSFTGTRRRAAMWLAAAWLVFGVSQAFATCCTPAGGSMHTSTHAMGAQQHQDAAAHDDCCDTAEQLCPMVLDEAPPAAPAAGLLVQDPIRHLGGLPVRLALRLPAAALADGPARVPVREAPPDPIYLRLQRFLI